MMGPCWYRVKEETMSTVYTICMQGKALDIAEICAPWDSPLSEDLLDGWTDLDFTMAMTSVLATCIGRRMRF